MSRNPSILNTLTEVPEEGTPQANQITLIDQTRPTAPVDPPENGLESAEEEDSDSTRALTPLEPLSKRLTSSSLRQTVKQQVDKQKYRRYQQDRFHDPDAEAPQPGDEATPAQKGYLGRGTARAKGMLRRKRTLGRGTEEDSVIDILYENQRGAFLFGIPMFSSSSLLNFDPKSWQNNTFRTSPVDIRNAQVPDPSWEWAWHNWYVDMSRDVDEEGWEYSFSFQKGFAWHGNHPWFHSFVRRRRWLRKRVRKHTVHHTKERSHELTADYFTIRPSTVRPRSLDSSAMLSSAQARAFAKVDDEPDIEKVEIPDIGTLLHLMRKAAVDREKLVGVRKFIDHGGDELFYLSDRMPEIMSLFVYQSSRRQLLTDLMQRFEHASTRKESLADHTHDDEETRKKHEAAAKHADNLLKAVNAADDQVKKLEYWSDIKSMAHEGQALHATDSVHWDEKKWQGLDPAAAPHDQESFKSKQHPSELPPELHKHPEHVDEKAANGKARVQRESDETDAGYVTAASQTPAVNGAKGVTRVPEPESEVEKYETPAETPTPSVKGKGKSQYATLDGVVEDEEDEEQLDGPPLERVKEEQRFEDAQEEPSHGTTAEAEKQTPVEVVMPKGIDADFGQDPVIME
ncbi:hypothetical protein B0A48_08747 [Cryoendolithus antarcticus]|uniref:Peroxin/Ferlin domain-containing protein n=1 Tax=Cryoendolithus antarcticus TaxID=1507870 RepID=A0A1V8T4C2_9PEZI|nr:hypothetical protein B0A48_08747 [Cryoendolithus antarcticus]